MDIDNYSQGSRTCGDLESLGWSIITSFPIHDTVKTRVSDIAHKDE